jgi:hypothetical protein
MHAEIERAYYIIMLRNYWQKLIVLNAKAVKQKDVVDTERVQAKYAEGVLHLLIPKMENAKQKQPGLIEIS